MFAFQINPKGLHISLLPQVTVLEGVLLPAQAGHGNFTHGLRKVRQITDFITDQTVTYETYFGIKMFHISGDPIATAFGVGKH